MLLVVGYLMARIQQMPRQLQRVMARKVKVARRALARDANEIPVLSPCRMRLSRLFRQPRCLRTSHLHCNKFKCRTRWSQVTRMNTGRFRASTSLTSATRWTRSKNLKVTKSLRRMVFLCSATVLTKNGHPYQLRCKLSRPKTKANKQWEQPAPSGKHRGARRVQSEHLDRVVSTSMMRANGRKAM